MTTAKLGSIQADCKGMQSTCRAGTGAHQDEHACWEDASDSHPSVARSRRCIRKHCSPKGSIAHLLYGIPRW